MPWTIVIPVKGTPDAKSRLGATAELARAIAVDTVAAAIGLVQEAGLVEAVIVVTTPSAGPDFEALGARVIPDPATGLGGAVSAGVAAAGDGAVAVLLGDLPALLGRELAAALVVAQEHPLCFVADSDGDGTVLITALEASDHRPAFGPGSAEAHLNAGYIELGFSPDSGLRRDVDTREQLDGLAAEGWLGSRSSAATR